MSVLYKVKVIALEKELASVTMNVKVVHPDAMRIHETAGFALQLLDNGRWKEGPLGMEVSYEDSVDDRWCRKYAKGIIKEMRIIKCLREAPPNFNMETDDPYLKNPEIWPEMNVQIITTNAAWLEHIKLEEMWESCAFDVARSYDKCEPILPQKNSNNEEKIDSENEGWMPIPSFLFDQGCHFLPNVMMFPKYSESSYVLDNITDYSDKSHQVLLSIHGKFIKHIKSGQSGIFVWNDLTKVYTIYSIGRNSSGTRSFHNANEVGKVATLLLRQGFPRRIENLSYSDIFRKSSPSIVKVERKGRHVTLTVTGIYDIDLLSLSKVKILKMICSNYLETFQHSIQLDYNFPISKLLAFFVSVKEDVFYPKDVLPLLADGIILNYSYEYPDEYVEDFDDMDSNKVYEYFDRQLWPCFKIKILLSDEAFGIQLDHVSESRMLISLSYLSSEFKEAKQPILWSDYEGLVD